MIVVLVHILIFGYTKFHQHDVYCTPSTKKLSIALILAIPSGSILFSKETVQLNNAGRTGLALLKKYDLSSGNNTPNEVVFST